VAGKVKKIFRDKGGVIGEAEREASVSGRSEYVNTCKYVNGKPAMNRRFSSKSASVSPGNPTITSAPMAASGMSARALYSRLCGRRCRVQASPDAVTDYHIARVSEGHQAGLHNR
jgi:hypothetical protein